MDCIFENGVLSGSSYNGQMDPVEFEVRRTNAEFHYKMFLQALGYSVEKDPNMQDSPRRVTKIFMEELLSGTYTPKPKVTTFPNSNQYTGIVFEGPIKGLGMCSHHLLPIISEIFVGYIAGETIIGLSKLNRICQWIAARPTLQENMTSKIHEELDSILKGNQGVAVYIRGEHECVRLRGVRDYSSVMITSKLSGVFLDKSDTAKQEFLQMVEGARK